MEPPGPVEPPGPPAPPPAWEYGAYPPPVAVCYRHPDRPTRIGCQRCGRPICPECMIPAPVGFQCPDCVAQGMRETRQAQAPFGGRRRDNTALTSMVLMVLNALAWGAIIATGGADSPLFWTLALTPEGVCTVPGGYYPGLTDAACAAASGVWHPGVADGAWWQLLTTAFTHLSPVHIGFNMLALWFLGPPLEQVLGRSRFLALYFGSALAGSVAVFWLADPSVTTVGASGALFGLMGGFLIVAWKGRGDVRSILMWLLANVAFTFLGGAQISWQGHFGGLAGGLAIAALIVFAPRAQRSRFQWVGVAVVLAVLLVAVALRALALA